MTRIDRLSGLIEIDSEILPLSSLEIPYRGGGISIEVESDGQVMRAYDVGLFEPVDR